MLKNFRTYQLALKFNQSWKKLTFPEHLRDQLRRASSSIALNLAEGWGKRTTKDRVHYYYIALGSLRECQAIFDLEDYTQHKAYEVLNQLGASVYRLINPKQKTGN